MKNFIKKTALVLTLALAVGMNAGGCRLKGKEVVINPKLSGNEVFCIDKTSCSLAEARVILLNYQNIYGTVYGVNLWQQDLGDNSLEQYVKDLTISQLAKVISMDLLADEQGISLTDEEQDRLREAAKKYYDSLNKKEIAYMGVKESDIAKLYRQYGLADKLYQSLTAGVREEVSDDEARVMTAQEIFVTSKEKADAVAAGLTQGTDFLALAGTYNEAEQTEVSFGRGDRPKAVEEVAFALAKDTISGAIETDNGYYFIKCINNYDQELTDANKQTILERRKKEAFDDVYDAFVAQTPSRMNEKLWDGVKLKFSDELKTDSFFAVYEEYGKVTVE